ncbi:MAG TPA: murein L,D-transpeptidase catalytic domain family protein [Coxiellaceae bacterium]|nr:murein L,D-transpeptidase catalytic domain family protein [Coxiellaceae bacterium]
MKVIVWIMVFSLSSVTLSANAFFGSSSLSTDPEDINKINPAALAVAMDAYQCAEKKGYIKNHLLTIIDFTLPSNEKRMWIIDPETHRSLYHLFVAHGVNSGAIIPTHFSNKMGSLESSLGAYLTAATYDGHHGYSLVLMGLERGVNDNAERRHIIIHSAWYVNPGFIHEYDRLGRSWGCFALDPKQTKEVINTLQGGSLVFAYAAQEQHDPNVQQCNLVLPPE